VEQFSRPEVIRLEVGEDTFDVAQQADAGGQRLFVTGRESERRRAGA
jgi:hypothetical protein